MGRGNLLLLLPAVFLAASCVRGPNVRGAAGGEIAGLREVKCVAVVPFDPRGGPARSGELFAHLVAQAALSSGRFRVMDGASVTRFLERQGVRIAPVVETELAGRLGSLMGVDALLMGSVEEYAYRNTGGREIALPAVSAQARLVSSGEGRQLWVGRARKVSGSPFSGDAVPLSGLAMAAAREMIAPLPGNVTAEQASEPCGLLGAELDVDGDGILNVADRCPFQAEDYDGVDDADGCPETGLTIGQVARLVAVEGGRLAYAGEVAFLEGTDTLLPHSRLLLRAIGGFLNRERARVPRLQVEGYSEEAGVRKYRELFAFARAEAVKSVLIEAGVDPNRLSCVGYDAEGIPGPRQGKTIEFVILE